LVTMVRLSEQQQPAAPGTVSAWPRALARTHGEWPTHMFMHICLPQQCTLMFDMEVIVRPQ
jgi:hypothetical protein